MDRRTFLKLVGLAVAGVRLPKEQLTVADIKKCRDELEKSQFKYLRFGVRFAVEEDIAAISFWGIDKDGVAHVLSAKEIHPHLTPQYARYCRWANVENPYLPLDCKRDLEEYHRRCQEEYRKYVLGEWDT